MKNLILDDFLERYGNSVYGKWNAPTDGIYIGRGSKFGNPYPMLKAMAVYLNNKWV